MPLPLPADFVTPAAHLPHFSAIVEAGEAGIALGAPPESTKRTSTPVPSVVVGLLQLEGQSFLQGGI